MSTNHDQEQLVNALETLQALDHHWCVVAASACLIVTRCLQDGSIDTLIVLSPKEACFIRENWNAGHVWSTTGSLPKVIAAVRELPALS
ncbi:hypothetical protein [Actinophytocola xanthii]|uniref:hypothetical protein n=1 Tax=Actinophytocola xanthii TaxID=1912961 RepID=UPI001177DEAA|nr:hypothetical protein [Actinophytocola xanthii]